MLNVVPMFLDKCFESNCHTSTLWQLSDRRLSASHFQINTLAY